MRQHTTALFLAAVLLVAPAAEATAVLALRFDQEVVIAADSRLIRSGTNEAVTGCKVKNFGDVVVANLGNFVFGHDSFPEVAETLQFDDGSTIVDRIGVFTQEAATLQPNPREGTETEVVGNPSEPIAFVFSFFEDELPVVEVRTVQDGLVVRRDTGIGFVRSGQRSLIDQISELTIQTLYHEVGVGPALDLLIRLQSRVSPSVMGPVDILRLTADGAEWLQRKPECRERE